MSATITQSRQLKSTLGDLLRSLEDGEKTAAAKEKMANLKKQANGKKPTEKKADDPGGYDGATAHPSKSVDDGTQTYPEGSHAAENETRVKEDEPMGVPHATPNDSGSQNDVQVDMGLTSKSTGTDPAVEQEFKDRPEDPGTSSDVDTSIGEKYSQQRAKLDEWVKQSEVTGSQFLAVLNKLAGTAGPGSPPATPPPTTVPPTTEPPVEGEEVKDALAGFEVAGALQNLPDEDKQAALNGIHAIMAETVKQAVGMATKTAEYLYGLEAGMKQAAEEPPMEEAPPEEGGGPPPEEGGGPPPEEGGGGGGGLSEEDLAQLLMQGEGMGGGGGGDMGGGGGGGGGLEELLAGAGGGGGGGGEDLAALLGGGGGGGGGGPEMGGGGPEMGGGPPGMGGGGGGGGGDVDPQMLQAILQEMGANPEQLEKAMAAKQAAMKKQAAVNQIRTKLAQQNRSKYGPKYDQVKKAVADLLGRRVA